MNRPLSRNGQTLNSTNCRRPHNWTESLIAIHINLLSLTMLITLLVLMIINFLTLLLSPILLLYWSTLWVAHKIRPNSHLLFNPADLLLSHTFNASKFDQNPFHFNSSSWWPHSPFPTAAQRYTRNPQLSPSPDPFAFPLHVSPTSIHHLPQTMILLLREFIFVKKWHTEKL